MAEKKRTTGLDSHQRELFENAQHRIKQKKRLTFHLVSFIAASLLLILLGLVMEVGKGIQPLNISWAVWIILIWSFFLLIHALNVLVVSKLMDKDWERRQLDYLVEKQEIRIEELQKKVDKRHPLPKQEEKDEELEGNLNPKNKDDKL